jgi:hypothetical protein
VLLILRRQIEEGESVNWSSSSRREAGSSVHAGTDFVLLGAALFRDQTRIASIVCNDRPESCLQTHGNKRMRSAVLEGLPFFSPNLIPE